MSLISYMATVLPGLETVLADEIQCKLIDVKRCSTTRGKVMFESQLPYGELIRLRTADNLYRIIGAFPAGLYRTDLLKLEKSISALDLSFIEAARISSDNYIVNASRKGRHTFSRFEAAEAAMRGIEKNYADWRKGTATDHSLEFRLDMEDEHALFSFRLTPPAFRYRGKERSFSSAALRPTIAHALIWLSSPAPSDRFIDPCCGSGTIIIERLAYPYDEVRGGDLSAEAVQAARTNWIEGCLGSVEQWDARQLPLDNSSANVIVSNLPFGRQIGERNELDGLYDDLLTEMSRVLQPGGRCFLLAEDGAPLCRAAERNGLGCSEVTRLSLKGLQPAIYRLIK